MQDGYVYVYYIYILLMIVGGYICSLYQASSLDMYILSSYIPFRGMKFLNPSVWLNLYSVSSRVSQELDAHNIYILIENHFYVMIMLLII